MDVKHHVYLLTSPAQSPGEIKRREMSWTLTKNLDHFAGPGEIKRREVVLDPQVSPGEIKSREVELGGESWTSFLLQVVTQQLCAGHCTDVPALYSSWNSNCAACECWLFLSSLVFRSVVRFLSGGISLPALFGEEFNAFWDHHYGRPTLLTRNRCDVLMWSLKKRFRCEYRSTLYLRLDLWNTRLESVRHSVSVCVSRRRLLLANIPEGRCCATCSTFTPLM